MVIYTLFYFDLKWQTVVKKQNVTCWFPETIPSIFDEGGDVLYSNVSYVSD